MQTVKMIFSQMQENEKSKKISNVRAQWLNHLSLTKKKLDLFAQFDNPKMSQLLFPKLLEISAGGYSKDKAFFDYMLEDSKKTLGSIVKSCEGVLDWIEQDETTIEELYDLNKEAKLIFNHIKHDYYSRLKSRIMNVSYEVVQEEIEKSFSELIILCDDLSNLLQDGIEPKQKSYWMYVEPVVSYENNELFVARNVKISQFNEKLMKIYLSVHEKLNGEKLAEAKPLATESLENLSKAVEKCKKLSEERMLQRLTGQTVFSSESTRHVFYTLYDSLEKILAISKEFDDGLKMIKENIKLNNENKNREQAALEIKKFEEDKQRKLEEYKKSIFQEQEKRALVRKQIKQELNTSKSATRKTMGDIQGNINKCGKDELKLIQAILKNSDACLEKSIDSLLVLLGFASRTTTEQGCLFTLGRLSVSYHKKHASDAKAERVDHNFISQLRKVFWELGINESLIELSLQGLEIKNKEKSAVNEEKEKPAKKKPKPKKKR